MELYVPIGFKDVSTFMYITFVTELRVKQTLTSAIPIKICHYYYLLVILFSNGYKTFKYRMAVHFMQEN